jgi:hypothetical protein
MASQRAQARFTSHEGAQSPEIKPLSGFAKGGGYARHTYLSQSRKELIEMHALPQRAVFELLEHKRQKSRSIRV